MISHLDIEAELSPIRISCLIVEKKDDLTGKYKVIMPALLIYKSDYDRNCQRDSSSIDNPEWLFNNFVDFLGRCLTDKITEEDKEYYADFLSVVITYGQLKEVLDMIKWIKDYGVQEEI